MDIAWDPRHTPAWDELHEAGTGPLQQHYAFGQAMQTLGFGCERALISLDGELRGIAQFVIRRPFGLLGLALCSRGPVWREGTDLALKGEACRLMAGSLPLRRPRFTLFAPEAGQESTASDSLKQSAADAGALRDMTRVYTGNATVFINLTASDDELRKALNPKWRNHLDAADSSPLEFHRGGEKPAQYQWLLERKDLQPQTRVYRAAPASFVPAWQVAIASRWPDRSALLTVRCDIGHDHVAAMMFLLHGRSATYYLGWSHAEGRQHNAHNLLLWRAFGLLREQGIDRLDLGDVNTQRGASLARFKLGTGGQLAINPGTYL